MFGSLPKENQMKKKSGEQDNANLVKALKGLLTKYTLAMDGGIVKTIDEKLGRLIKAEQDLLALRETMATKDKEVEALKAKLADRQTLALQMNFLARAMQERANELKRRDANSATLVATLISQRSILVEGGSEAESLRAVLKSVNEVGAPDGFDEPTPTLTADGILIRIINENTPPVPKDEFESILARMFDPTPEHSGPDSMLPDLADILKLFGVPHGMHCSMHCGGGHPGNSDKPA